VLTVSANYLLCSTKWLVSVSANGLLCSFKWLVSVSADSKCELFSVQLQAVGVNYGEDWFVCEVLTKFKALWLFYVPPSFTSRNLTFCPQFISASYSTIAQDLTSSACYSYQEDQREKPGNLPKSMPFRNLGSSA
jgi:hypothetical protein